MDSLETLSRNVENFIADVVRIDDDAAKAINQSKEEFYDKYNYLKPKCEKNLWEKICDGFAAAGEWCKEHWKLIITAVLVIASVAVIILSGGTALGALGPVLLMIAQGTIIGAVSGGLIGGLSSLLTGGSFFGGFEEGAFGGAIGGAIFGGLGAAGQAIGKGISCIYKIGKFIKGLSIVSGAVSSGMAVFDLLAMADLLIDSDNNWLYEMNQKLHSSTAYNWFQLGVSALAVFTGGMSQTMTCFVAGTMILTAAGLTAIEHIKAGDKVISTNPETFETAEKSVLKTYVRQTDKLIHLVIGGEEIITTETHPFYVKDRGFVEAGELQAGEHLLNVNGKELLIEEFWSERLDEPETVYNFQVEDFHTYFVGENKIWVHNADYPTSVKQLYDNSKPGKRTKGRTEQRIVDGDFNTALRDFETLHPTDVKSISTPWGTGKTGNIDNGFVATVRPGSSYGKPTLEIRNPLNCRGLEFRYE